MKIIFFGIPEMGTMCLEHLIKNKKNIIAVVPPKQTNPGCIAMEQTATSYGIDVIKFNKSPKEKDFQEKIKTLNADIGIVCSFDCLLPKDLLDIPKFGFINCHPSLLPHYRGGNPYFHVIANQETKTGVTIHYMDSDFDTGDIIEQWETPVIPNETIGTMFFRLTNKTSEMLLDVVNKLEKNETLPRKIQDKTGNYKTSPKVKVEDGHTFINWKQEATQIDAFVRACNPVYGSITSFRGCTVKIFSGYHMNNNEFKDKKPGSIVAKSKDLIAINTTEGLYIPTVLQVGFYFIVDVREFIQRLNPQIGEEFIS